ncbi:glycosyltransferase family 39 protein [Pseudomonas chlororaphis]|uniref:glycosyltransferase family 39 protein n=1 Tax=Pseudomonas chlororaphis TaxID=587753 RepID=UPI002367B122|nr:glycosyltransferase family 39 protein [Pseudomonas chlororaphis]WDG81069.1 glycosyltransferase family 39 protein [Pseudomonas chlororaphis]WDG85878.1 glycosyltransferase family 39 protein [Pseudomonas chlororaphis]
MPFRRESQLLDTAEPGIANRLTSDAQRLIAVLRAYWLLPILLLAAATRFYDLTAAAIWGDEGSSLLLSRYGLSELWVHAAHDVHPPLYFMLLRGWIALFGDGIFAIRSFSAWPGIVCVGLGVWLVAQIASRRAAILAGFLLALLPTAVRYSQEVRMYALLGVWLLGTTIALVYWVRQPRRQRYLVYYTLLMSAAFYTHYFTALCVLVHWAYLLLLRLQATPPSRAINQPGWWLANLAIVMLFAPWLPGLVDLLQHIDQLKASGDVGWEPSVDFSSLPSMVWQLLTQDDGETRSPLLFAGLPLLVLSVVAVLAWRDRSPWRWHWLLVIYTLLPLLLVFAVSFVSPVFIERYLTAYALGLPLIFAIAVDRLLAQARVLALAILLLFGGAEVVGLNNNATVDANDQISVLVDYVNQRYLAGDRIVTSDLLWYLSYVYYNRTDAQPLLYTPPTPAGVSTRPNAYGFGTLIDQQADRIYLDRLSALPVGSGRVWLIGTADQPDEFAPLPAHWRKTGEFTAGGVTARLLLMCGMAQGQASVKALCSQPGKPAG